MDISNGSNSEVVMTETNRFPYDAAAILMSILNLISINDIWNIPFCRYL